MHKITLFIFAAVFAVALAEGQYYVPRAYYTIDAEGHESARVPLRRLRRSIQPLPYAGGAKATANANNYGPGNADAEATANNYGSRGLGNGGGNNGWSQGGNGGWNDGGWGTPGRSYGSLKPLAAGETRRMYGSTEGRSVSARTSVSVDPDGNGYYDQSASTY